MSVEGQTRRVRVLVNRRSGLARSFATLERAVAAFWERPGTDVSYQFCRDTVDGVAKAKRAAAEGVDVLLVAGGDGTVNTVGSALIGTDVALGVVPTGSGNGFARHFGLPLSPRKAVQVLASAPSRRIDVGVVNGRPFLVTCSMAWTAAMVRSFDRSPIRGVLPYVFAGVYEFLDYTPREMIVELDSGETLTIPDPLVFTIANLTQFGGGAVIAPQARADDGLLELVVARHQDIPHFLANIGKVFSGDIDHIPKVLFRRFRRLTVRRDEPAPIQVDGELMEASACIEVSVMEKALKVLVPVPPPGHAPT